jgi:hypothetical protein
MVKECAELEEAEDHIEKCIELFQRAADLYLGEVRGARGEVGWADGCVSVVCWGGSGSVGVGGFGGD